MPKKQKKIRLTILTIAFALTASVGAAIHILEDSTMLGYTGETLHVTQVHRAALPHFSDTLPPWAASAIAELHYIGVIQGSGDGTFGADAIVSNRELTETLYRLLLFTHLIEQSSNCMHHTDAAFCAFEEHAWFIDPDLNPHHSVRREELAQYINRIFGPALLQSVGTSQGFILAKGQQYEDIPPQHPSFYDVGLVHEFHIMDGRTPDEFDVTHRINRAEMAVVIHRLLSKIEKLSIQNLDTVY